MTAVLLTCPDALLCKIGIEIAVDEAALHALDGIVTKHGPFFAVELRDPVDAVLALQRLEGAYLTSFVASRAAWEMLLEDAEPIRGACTWLQRMVAHPVGVLAGFVRHFNELFARPLPREIAEQELPDADVVLWSAWDGRVIAVDRDDFRIGRGSAADFQIESGAISRNHVAFRKAPDASWHVVDLGSSSGFYLNDGRGGQARRLLPGMVIQFARPWSLVVLAVR